MPQSTVHCLRRLVLAAIFTGLVAGEAAALTLKPWKDELFSYGTVIETADEVRIPAYKGPLTYTYAHETEEEAAP